MSTEAIVGLITAITALIGAVTGLIIVIVHILRHEPIPDVKPAEKPGINGIINPGITDTPKP